MGKAMSTTRNRRHDSSLKNTFKTCENSGVILWSDLNQDVLYLVMMKLGVIDFVAFSGVCKSWRAFALSNRKRFMASRPPMLMWFRADKKKYYFYLEDSEGRRFKTIIPHSGDKRSCVGLTCGYLVFYVEKTFHNDFLLVNPITRHQLHFPAAPSLRTVDLIKGILVFSPSIPGWVLVVISWHHHKIWFSVAGKGAWNDVSCNDYFLDIHAFKGKIYTLNSGWHLYELRLNPRPNLSKLEFSDLGEQEQPMYRYHQALVSLGENVYVIDTSYKKPRILYELDFKEMKRVSPEEMTLGEHAIFLNKWIHGVAIKTESWAVDPWSKYITYDLFLGQNTRIMTFNANRWYFPHRCLDVDLINV